MISSSDRELFFHVFPKVNRIHYYEIDLLLASKTKLTVIEVKSSGIGQHQSLKLFKAKYSQHIGHAVLLSKKDLSKDGDIEYISIYMTPYLFE